MGAKSDNPFKFWQELKRRKVIRVLTVYGAAAFVLIEVTNNVTDSLNLPDWISKWIVIILGIGLIITVLLSWIFDITPEGIQKTLPVEELQTEDRPVSSNSWRIATYASFLVIVVLILLNIFSGTFRSAQLSNLQKSVAVLPLRYLSNDSSRIHFCGGMQDEINGHLSRISTLSVRSRSSTGRYKDTDKTSMIIGEELRANFLIVGSVAFDKNKIKVWIQLILAETDEHLWANEYQEELSDIFTLQSEIAKDISRELKVVLTPEERINIDKKPTENIDAYNHYLIGNYLLYQLTPDSFWKAIDQYEKAIALDSEFAEAYCNLAFIYIHLMGWFVTPSEDYIPIVKSNLLKALELDNKLGDAYYMLGTMNYLHEWDWAEAEKNFRKGLDLNPNFILGMIEYANFLSSMRRFDESFRISKRTIELDPLNPVALNELSFPLWLTGEREQALEVLDESLKLDTGHQQTLWGSMVLNTELGNFNKALSFLEKLKGNNEIIEIQPYLLGQAGKLMVYLGRREEAMAYLSELNRRADEEGYKDTFPQAVICIALGEHEKALELLEQAFVNRDFAMAQMNINMDLEPLRSYERFQNIMKKMNFP
jgi:TolB-like protein/Tfp pilus assembly protein PilF